MIRINGNDQKAYRALLGSNRIPFLVGGGGSAEGLEFQYSGAACFFIGGGPSFTPDQAELLRQPGLITYGVNNSAKTFRPHIWSCVDEAGRFLRSTWEDPTILKVVPAELHKHRIFDSNSWQWTKRTAADCANVLFFRRSEFFDPATFFVEPTVCWGNAKELGGARSVMLASLRLIQWLGFSRLYLCGVDFKMSAEYAYNFPQARKPGAVKNNGYSYRVLAERFESLKPYLKAVGLEVHNCSPGSELNAFPRMELKDAVARELKNFPDPLTERVEGLYDVEKPK